MSIRSEILILLSTIVLISCKEEVEKPRLVVLISIDQLAHHTYTNYLPMFTDGFKWLHDHGVTFDNAHHEHGYTGTGPGHFALGSGLYPGPAGMIGNSWYDRKSGKNIYCVEDSSAHSMDTPAYSVSYKNVNGSAFGDWLKAVSPDSKVYSVACKDRAAILMGGKNPDAAIWYNWRGEFTSTDYYFENTPQWVTDFNTENNMISYRDSVWTKSWPDSVYSEYAHPDSFFGESDRYLNEYYTPIFPLGFEEEWDDSKIFSEMGGRPWMDRMTLELATRAVDVGALGQDNIPDVLTIGLSVMDIVGHHYGPYSHEAMDLMVKMDQYLGDFLDRLDEQVGLENVLVVMTSDHGVLPLPEHWTQVQGRQGGRIDGEAYQANRAKAYAKLDSLYGNHDFIHRKGSCYYYNYSMMDSMGIDSKQVDPVMQQAIESVEGIHRLYTRAELLAADISDPPKMRLSRFVHSELSPDLYTLVDKGWLFYGPYGTNHGTPYEYDSHIPLVFSRENFDSVILTDSVATVDIAPTVGDILGVTPTNKVDGTSLRARLMGE